LGFEIVTAAVAPHHLSIAATAGDSQRISAANSTGGARYAAFAL